MKKFIFFLLFFPCFLYSQTESINVSQDSLTDHKYIEGKIKIIGYSEKENFVLVFWKNLPILKRKVYSIFELEIYFNFYEADYITVKMEKNRKSKVVFNIKSINDEFLPKYTMGRSKQSYQARINGRP